MFGQSCSTITWDFGCHNEHVSRRATVVAPFPEKILRHPFPSLHCDYTSVLFLSFVSERRVMVPHTDTHTLSSAVSSINTDDVACGNTTFAFKMIMLSSGCIVSNPKINHEPGSSPLAWPLSSVHSMCPQSPLLLLCCA